jgi:nitroimidazol reductase NimA-like FMN-containing flavoprotein (pyridoxamine 5'-phosphate oxidase superfamily)
MTRILDRNEAWAIIEAGKLGRLGCIQHAEPYVVPINYLVDDGQIYVHSLPGRKINALRENHRACLQADEILDELHWRSAIAFGEFEEINNEPMRKQVMQQLRQRFPKLTPVESLVTADVEPQPVIVFRLRVDRVTGVAEE